MSRPVWQETFVVLRDSHEESTVAIVKAVVETRELCQQANFLAALKKAITLWVSETKTGMSAWKESSEDFNIGDLANIVGTANRANISLAPYLNEAGILQMTVTPAVSMATGPWSYDTVLAHKDQIDE